MSTVDTSSWNPDADLNTAIEGIPLNADAGIAQTWQALRVLMAAVKGDGDAIKAMIDVMQGATASADGDSGLVPKPLAGDHDKFLKGDGTWDDALIPNLGTASRAVQTDANGALAVSSVTSTELGYLSGVTSAVQTQLDAKATDSGVVHNSGAETIAGGKTFTSPIVMDCSSASYSLRSPSNSSYQLLCGGRSNNGSHGATLLLYGADASSAGLFQIHAGNSFATKNLIGKPDGTLTWNGQAIQTSSDERLKTSLETVPDAVLDAWGDVCWGQFQYLDAVEAKGGSARLHLGLIAQRVKAVFEARGLDACEYGILCHEVRPEVNEPQTVVDAEAYTDEQGVEHPAVTHIETRHEEAVDLWMVRYAEAQAMESAFQRRRADRLEARIAALEERLNG